MKNNRLLVLSCEHAVNAIPEAYTHLFASYTNLLDSHQGIDFGALALATQLQKHFQCELVSANVSRLLIDCNRSLGHPGCFSKITGRLTEQEKQQIVQQYYLPFRQRIEHLIKQHLASHQPILHLSMHSFTPVLNGVKRQADIGLLYNPSRQNEKAFAKHWRQGLRQFNPCFQVRLNYPYRGTSDGFTTALRKQYTDTFYIGLEVESNQALVNEKSTFVQLANTLTATLDSLLTDA